MKKRLLIILLTLIFLLVPTTFFSCTSTKTAFDLALPQSAETEAVSWQDDPTKGGLVIKYSEYRKLEKNIIELRREIAELRAMIKLYRAIK